MNIDSDGSIRGKGDDRGERVCATVTDADCAKSDTGCTKPDANGNAIRDAIKLHDIGSWERLQLELQRRRVSSVLISFQHDGLTPLLSFIWFIWFILFILAVGTGSSAFIDYSARKFNTAAQLGINSSQGLSAVRSDISGGCQ